MSHKKSKNPRYDDPSAFKQQFPVIRRVTDDSLYSPLETVSANVEYYTMGKVKVIVHRADDKQGWFMSVQHKDRYPTWDEVVWLRYNLIPDAALMSMNLPNLNAYINQEDTSYRNVFTMDQIGWALNPVPEHCGRDMVTYLIQQPTTTAVLKCSQCGHTMQIDLNTWNEESGNGFNGKVKTHA